MADLPFFPRPPAAGGLFSGPGTDPGFYAPRVPPAFPAAPYGPVEPVGMPFFGPRPPQAPLTRAPVFGPEQAQPQPMPFFPRPPAQQPLTRRFALGAEPVNLPFFGPAAGANPVPMPFFGPGQVNPNTQPNETFFQPRRRFSLGSDAVNRILFG